MRKLELDAILKSMIESYEGISDLVFAVGRPLQVEAQGVLKTVRTQHNIAALTPTQIERIALNIIRDDRRLFGDLLRSGSCDCGYGIDDRTRFRVNIFRQRGNWAIVMRRLQTETPSIQTLNLPHIFLDMVEEKKRADPRHRSHGQRQNNHPGQHAQRDQPNQSRPRHHLGRPG